MFGFRVSGFVDWMVSWYGFSMCRAVLVCVMMIVVEGCFIGLVLGLCVCSFTLSWLFLVAFWFVVFRWLLLFG